MNRTEDQISELLGQAWQMPYGRAQVAAVEEVIRHADAQGLAEIQYAARILAVTAYTYAGEPEKAFVPFAWCLSVLDRGEADPHYDDSLLWDFKSIITALLSFPEVPLDRTRAVLDDMERRYRAAGHTMNPVHMCRAKVARHIGDQAAAAEQYRLWCAAPHGEMADCAGCEPTAKIAFLIDDGRDEEAIALARPVLDGQLTCPEQPAAILTGLLTAYVRTGRHREAADAHRTAYRLLRAKRADMTDVAAHIAFCARTGNEARAVELVNRHLSWLDEPPSPSAEMWFAASAALALRRAGQPGHAEHAERALAIAARFDARNGTSRVGDRVRDRLTAEPLAETVSLSVARHVSQVAPAAQVPVLPETAGELVEFARRQAMLHNTAGIDAAWARFDQILPEPAGLLRAQRLDARAGQLMRSQNPDPEAAEALWAEAATCYEAEADLTRAHHVRQRVGTLMCLTDRAEAGLALAEQGAEAVRDADAEQRWKALVQLAHAQAACHRHDDAAATISRAHDLAEELPVEWRADTALTAAQLLASVDQAGARTAAERAVALFGPLGAPNALAESENILARLLAAGGDLQRAFDTLVTTADDPSVRARVLTTRAAVALDLGRPDVAADGYGEASASFAAAGLPVPAAYACVDFAAACLDADRPDRAAEAVEDAIGVLEDLGDHAEVARARYLLALAHQRLGQPEPALPLLADAADFFRAAEAWPVLGQALGVTADLLDHLDRDAEAAAHYDQAADAFAAGEDPVGELHNRRRAALSWHWAEDQRAMTSLSAAESCDPDPEIPGARWELAILGYDGARILDAADRKEEALARAESAIGHFTAVDAAHQAAIAATMRGRLLLDLGRRAEAKTALTSALADLPDDDPNREQVAELLASL